MEIPRELIDALKAFEFRAPKGFTYYLPMYERADGCRYCRRGRKEHDENGRCPITGCTLEGPPK